MSSDSKYTKNSVKNTWVILWSCLRSIKRSSRKGKMKNNQVFKIDLNFKYWEVMISNHHYFLLLPYYSNTLWFSFFIDDACSWYPSTFISVIPNMSSSSSDLLYNALLPLGSSSGWYGFWRNECPRGSFKINLNFLFPSLMFYKSLRSFDILV